MVYPDDKPVPASHHVTRAQLAKLPLPSTAGNHSILGHSNGAPVTGTKTKQQQVLPVLPSRRPALWSWPWQNCSNTAPLSEVVSMLSIVPSVLLGFTQAYFSLYPLPGAPCSAQCPALNDSQPSGNWNGTCHFHQSRTQSCFLTGESCKQLHPPIPRSPGRGQPRVSFPGG